MKPAVAIAALLLLLGVDPGRAGDVRDAGTNVQANNFIIAANQGSTPAESPTYLREVLPILMGRCARCHGDQTRVLPNWLDYKTAFADRVEIKRRVWNSWQGSYYKQPMPVANCAEALAMTEAERAIIRDWVAKGAPRGMPPTNSLLLSRAERVEAGRILFGAICATCHQPNGYGIPSRFPPLAGSDYLNADKHRAIKIVTSGLQGEVIVNGQKFNNRMPRFPLGDQDVASVLTFVYSSFGNSGQEVTAQEVTAVCMEKDQIVTDKQNGLAAAQEKNPFE